MHIVDRLIKAGVNVNAQDEHVTGNTPLGDIADTCSYDMAKRLIDAGTDPTMPGWMMLTAIDRAEKRTDADARKVQRLLTDTARRLHPSRQR
jgi:hypothetical protein